MKWHQYAAEASLWKVILLIYLWRSVDGIFASLVGLPVQIQAAVISACGFLGAGAIAGSFNLTYEKTRMGRHFDRWLAHFTKFSLYLAIGLLFEVAIVGVSVASPGGARRSTLHNRSHALPVAPDVQLLGLAQDIPTRR